MPEGPEKVATLAALPAFPPSECAGDAKKDFERVNAAIDQVGVDAARLPDTTEGMDPVSPSFSFSLLQVRASGGAAVVHCVASLSRSVAFILAYIMKDRKCTVVEVGK